MPNILALHGFTGVGRDFDLLRGAFPGCQWYAPDLKGGRSQVFQAINQAIKSIDGQFVLLGYSMGGRLAYQIIEGYRDRIDALVVISATPGLEGSEERAQRQLQDEQLAARIEAIGVSGFIKEWQEHPLIRSQGSIPEAFRKAMLLGREQHKVEDLTGLLRELSPGVLPSMWPILDELSVPLTVVSGQNDSKYELIANRVQSRVRGARHCIIPDSGHAPHLEKPEEFLKILENVIEKEENSASLL